MANQKHDLVEYPIQDNVVLQAYWRDDAGGRGPAASLYVYDDEIMRFDCFGGGQWTLPLQPTANARQAVDVPNRFLSGSH